MPQTLESLSDQLRDLKRRHTQHLTTHAMTEACEICQGFIYAGSNLAWSVGELVGQIQINSDREQGQ